MALWQVSVTVPPASRGWRVAWARVMAVAAIVADSGYSLKINPTAFAHWMAVSLREREKSRMTLGRL